MWIKQAICVGEDPEVFFPEKGDEKTLQLARSICAQCPVRIQCLEANRYETFGIFGGTTPEERRKHYGKIRFKDPVVAGGTRSPKSHTFRRMTGEDKWEAERLYRDGLTCKEVAKELDVSLNSVEKLIAHLGIGRSQKEWQAVRKQRQLGKAA